MSTQALTGTGMPADLQAAAAREAQLQTLISRVQNGGSSSSFATALQKASANQSPMASSAGYSPSSTYQGLGSAAGYSPSMLDSAAGGTSTAPDSSGSAYDGLIDEAATRNGLNPALLHGLIQQESGFDPNAQSGSGALGLTQLMPSTAASLGVTEPLNPAQSIEGGARYLSQLMSQFQGNTTDALAAYNAGPAAVEQYGGVPPYPETESYVSKVLGYAETYQPSTPATTLPGALQ